MTEKENQETVVCFKRDEKGKILQKGKEKGQMWLRG